MAETEMTVTINRVPVTLSADIPSFKTSNSKDFCKHLLISLSLGKWMELPFLLSCFKLFTCWISIMAMKRKYSGMNTKLDVVYLCEVCALWKGEKKNSKHWPPLHSSVQNSYTIWSVVLYDGSLIIPITVSRSRLYLQLRKLHTVYYGQNIGGISGQAASSLHDL